MTILPTGMLRNTDLNPTPDTILLVRKSLRIVARILYNVNPSANNITLWYVRNVFAFSQCLHQRVSVTI